MASQKFMEFLSSNDKLRMNEMKLIEQEQFYIAQLKEQREKMEILRMEFLKKDQQIQELQSDNEQLQDECEQLREVYQEQIQNQEAEYFRSNKLQVDKDNLIKDLAELRDLVSHLKNENDALNSLQIRNDDQQRQLQDQLLVLAEENSRLKTEISRLDEFLFAYEPLKKENQRLHEKLKQYKIERKKILNDIKSSKQEINKQVEEFKQIVQKDFQNEMHKLEEYKDLYIQQRNQLDDMEQQCLELANENNTLKQEIKSLYEKEESEIKIKSEIDRVRQDLMSVRCQEVQRLNEVFNGIISLSSLANSRDQFN